MFDGEIQVLSVQFSKFNIFFLKVIKTVSHNWSKLNFNSKVS